MTEIETDIIFTINLARIYLEEKTGLKCYIYLPEKGKSTKTLPVDMGKS